MAGRGPTRGWTGVRAEEGLLDVELTEGEQTPGALLGGPGASAPRQGECVQAAGDGVLQVRFIYVPSSGPVFLQYDSK